MKRLYYLSTTLFLFLIIMGCTSESDGETNLCTDPNTDNAVGTYSWHSFYGSDKLDRGYSVSVDISGEIYVTGVSYSNWSGPDGQSPLNNATEGSAVFVLKLGSSGEYLWHTFFGGSWGDSGYSIGVDGNGGVYVTGKSEGSWNGPGGQAPVNEYPEDLDFFVLKLDTDGVYQWHTFYGCSEGAFAWALDVDDSGNTYVSGSVRSGWNGPEGQPPIVPHSEYINGDNNIFILKLDSNGEYLWHTFYETGAGNGADRSLAVDTLGNVYVSGATWTSWNGPEGQSPLNSGSIFVLKLASNGEYQWHTFYGYSQSHIAIAVDETDDIYLTGNSSYSWNGPDEQTPLNTHSGGDDIFVLKLDSDGAYVWHTYSGSEDAFQNDTIPKSLAVDMDANVHVTGFAGHSWDGPDDQNSIDEYSGSRDAFVLKLDSSGTYQWHTYHGSNDYEVANSLAVDQCGNIYMIGSSDISWNGPDDESPLNTHSGGGDDYYGDYEEYSDIFVLKIND